MPQRIIGLGILMLALSAGSISGCKKKQDTPVGPEYPACETNAQCADHNQFCLNGTCKDCRNDGDCQGACATGNNGTCGKLDACCTSDKDCGANQTCVKKPGAANAFCE